MTGSRASSVSGRLERVRERRIDVAIRADDQQPALAELTSHEPQQQQRGLVRGVEVVEHHHQRLRGRHALQEGGERIEQAEARSLGLDRRRRRQIGEPVPQLGSSRATSTAPSPSWDRRTSASASRRYGRSDCTHGQ